MNLTITQYNKKDRLFPKIIVKHKETGEVFKLVGGITLESGEDKLVIENEHIKRICSFSTLKKNYWKIGTYD